MNTKKVGIKTVRGVKVVVPIGKCESCKKSFDKVQRAFGGFCIKCDTSSAGTWLLSYLTELEYILNDDTVENGYVVGSTSNNFLDLPDGIPIFCEVDKYDKGLFHASVDLEAAKHKIINHLEDDESSSDEESEQVFVENDGPTDEKEEEWDDVFWKKPGITKIDFRINLGIQTSRFPTK